jgi:hypothetical protein
VESHAGRVLNGRRKKMENNDSYFPHPAIKISNVDYKPSPKEKYLHPSEGMMIRDYFAGIAIQGMVASDMNFNNVTVMAEIAYEIADALMKERKKKNE